MTKHSEAVDGLYEEVKQELENKPDHFILFKEDEYVDVNPPFNPVGEFDIGYINVDSQDLTYIELKTNPDDIGKARTQLERAKGFIEDETPYTFHGYTATPSENSDGYTICEYI